MRYWLLRLHPLFEGEGGAGAASGGAEGGEEGKGSGEGSGGAGANSDGAKTLTEAEAQAKIDAAVKDRLAREKKKNDAALQKLQTQLDELTGKKTDEGAGGGEGTADAASQEALRTAKDLVTKANAALLNTAAQSEAMKQGVNPEYLADAVKLADLSGAMDEEGKIDSKKVSAAVSAVIQRVPAFKLTQEGGQGFRIGGEGGSGPSGNGWNKNKSSNPNNSEPKRWNRFRN